MRFCGGFLRFWELPISKKKGKGDRFPPKRPSPPPPARAEGTFDPIRGPVLLRRLTDDQERKAGDKRSCRGERDGAELGRGQERRVRRMLGCLGRDELPERAEQLRPRLEAVLVEVVLRPSAGAEDEVAL